MVVHPYRPVIPFLRSLITIYCVATVLGGKAEQKVVEIRVGGQYCTVQVSSFPEKTIDASLHRFVYHGRVLTP